MSKKVPVYISENIVNEIRMRVKESEGEFQSIEEYIEFILSEILKEEEPKKVFSPEEEKIIKERLRRLGYTI